MLLSWTELHTRRPVGPPYGIADEVGHVVIQILDKVQDIVDEEDCVIIPIQDPLKVVHAVRHVCNEGRHCSPAQFIGLVTSERRLALMDKHPYMLGLHIAHAARAWPDGLTCSMHVSCCCGSLKKQV